MAIIVDWDGFPVFVVFIDSFMDDITYVRVEMLWTPTFLLQLCQYSDYALCFHVICDKINSHDSLLLSAKVTSNGRSVSKRHQHEIMERTLIPDAVSNIPFYIVTSRAVCLVSVEGTQTEIVGRPVHRTATYSV